MFSSSFPTAGGRGVMISGSRPTIIVSVWCRGMAPPPYVGIADHHEAGDLVDRLVLPLRFERGTVTTFVPTAVPRLNWYRTP